MFRKLSNDELGRISTQEYKQAQKLPVTVVLDNVRSMHNIGSVFRTADSFFIEHVILCGICATPPQPEIHKSALGAEFSVDWSYFKETIKAVEELKAQGYKIISVEQAERSVSLENINDILTDETCAEAAKASAKAVAAASSKKAARRGELSPRRAKYALIFGNEVMGVEQAVVDASDMVLEIPQFGTKHSLNISVSAGVVLWEFCKKLKL